MVLKKNRNKILYFYFLYVDINKSHVVPLHPYFKQSINVNVTLFLKPKIRMVEERFNGSQTTDS